MSFLTRWWNRPLPRRRAVVVLALMVFAIALFAWQAIADTVGSTTGRVIAGTCAVLLLIDSVRIGAGLAADRYPRD